MVLAGADDEARRAVVARVPHAAPATTTRAPEHTDDELDLLAELATAARLATASEALALGCRRLAEVFGVERCSVVAELGGELDVLATNECLAADAARGSDGGVCPRSMPVRALDAVVEQVMREGRPRRVEWPGTGSAGPFPAGRGASAVGLAVPVSELGALVVEGPPGWVCDSRVVRLATLAAAVLGDVARSVCREHDRAYDAAAADALRQLLEMGVRAGSPMEAALALASTAARVLDVPVACAYLVDEGGRITAVSTLGAAPGLAERLRAGLVGQLASGSPVWRRTVEGAEPGPDVIDDVVVGDSVRPGGVADLLELRALAAIPLLSSDGPLGLVLCGHPEPRTRWRPGTRELLSQLALEGTVVVDNARLRAVERYDATHDALTGLLNRKAFLDALESQIGHAKRSGSTIAVLLLDLDRFKEVNDYLGHLHGDALLVDVAARLQSSLRQEDSLARLGGDEFALMLTTGATRSGAEVVAAKIAASLDAAFEVGGHTLHVDASVGVALYPDHALDATGLLQRADTAMYTAKGSGMGSAVYDCSVEGRAAEALGLLGELRRALQGTRELRLHYQPKIELRTGHVSGVEALVRWAHPRHGLLGPDRFVPLAEETGLVRTLTSFVVPEALAQVRSWQELGIDLRVAVNISARDVSDKELPAKVAQWLDNEGVEGRSLVVEVTERTVMDDRSHAAGALESLRELGIEVSLDDFGSGYSSLAYLESLPVDEIKIDRQFLCLGRSRRSVIRSIIALGHDLDMRVVAEGVETQEHAEWLARMGCDEAQGYHFSRPLPAVELERWIASAPDEPGWLNVAARD